MPQIDTRPVRRPTFRVDARLPLVNWSRLLDLLAAIFERLEIQSRRGRIAIAGGVACVIAASVLGFEVDWFLSFLGGWIGTAVFVRVGEAALSWIRRYRARPRLPVAVAHRTRRS